MSLRILIQRPDGELIWEGLGEIQRLTSPSPDRFSLVDERYVVTVDAPLELVPDMPFVRLPKEREPDA